MITRRNEGKILKFFSRQNLNIRYGVVRTTYFCSSCFAPKMAKLYAICPLVCLLLLLNLLFLFHILPLSLSTHCLVNLALETANSIYLSTNPSYTTFLYIYLSIYSYLFSIYLYISYHMSNKYFMILRVPFILNIHLLSFYPLHHLSINLSIYL